MKVVYKHQKTKSFQRVEHMLNRSLTEMSYGRYDKDAVRDTIGDVFFEVKHWGKTIAIGRLRYHNNLKEVEIGRIYTVLQHRGKGIAYRLIHEMERYILAKSRRSGIKRNIILYTREKYESAFNLYVRMGYNCVSTDDDGKIKMKKTWTLLLKQYEEELV